MMMTIGDVGQRTGVPTSTIRYYERIGLIASPERRNGQRRYGVDILRSLRLIRMAQEAGFTLEEVHTLLNGFDEQTPPGVRWRELAERKLPEVDTMMQRLSVIRRVLEESLTCDCLTLDACADEGWHQSAEPVGHRTLGEAE